MSLILQADDNEGVVTLTFNDPDRRNAMSLAMATEFRNAVHALIERPQLRGVMITGAGSAFAAGGDLAMLEEKANLDEETNRRLMVEFYKSFLCILKLPVPVVAAINGHAIGAGLALALACDVRISTLEAKFGLTFTKLALHPGMASTLFLPRIVGQAAATELLLSGRVFPADEAHQLGLIAKPVANARLTAVARETIEGLATAGAAATPGILTTLRPKNEELSAAMDREASQQAKNYASVDFAQRIAAARKRS